MDYHDGKYGVNTDPERGADTFIPFKSDLKRFYTTITGTSALTQYTVGFKPKIILFCVNAGNQNSVAIYDEITNKCYYNGYFDTPYNVGDWVYGLYRISELMILVSKLNLLTHGMDIQCLFKHLDKLRRFSLNNPVQIARRCSKICNQYLPF